MVLSCLYVLLVMQQLPFSWTVFSRVLVSQATLEDRDNVSLQSRGQGCSLSSIIKIIPHSVSSLPVLQDLDSLNSGSSCNRSNHVFRHHLPFHVVLWELGWQAGTNAYALMAAISVSNKVLCCWQVPCVLLASRNLWQASLLGCR